MRVTEKMTSDNAIFNINKSQNRLNQLNELLSSNQNINRPSDDPIGTRQILDMQSQVRSIDQYMNNIQNGQTWTSVATIALQGMNDFLTQAKAAASNILGGTNDSVSVSNTLATLENVRQQMIDLANVQVGDQYVFGGFNNATPVVSNKKLSGVVDVSKSPNQIAFSDTSGLIVGMTVSGAGIQPETTITAIDTINKVVTISKNPLSTKSGFDYTFGLPPTSQKGNTSFTANQSQITGINTTGLSVGDQVTGPGVTLGNTILSIDSAGQVTLAQPLTKATIGGVFNFVPRIYQTGDTAAGTSTITNLPSTAGFRVGSAVTGPGVPAGTTIASVDIAGPGGQVTLSQNITQTVTGGTFAFTPTLIRTGNSGTISTLFATAAIATPTTISNVDTTVLNVGGTVTGPGVPPGTTILAINGATNQITISNAITQDVSTGGDFTFTSSLNVIKGLDTTNLGVGDTVTGPGIPAGTTIFSVDSASQITLSAPMTSAVSGGIFSFTPAVGPAVGTQSGNTSFSSSQVTGLDTTNLLTGMTISGPGVQSGTTIASIDSTSQITLSNPLTKVTTGGTFIFLPTTTKTVAGTGGTTNLSNQLAGLANVTGLAVGMSISGAGLPVNTIITKIDTSIPAAPVIYLNNNATQTTAGGTYTFGPTVTKAGTTNPPNQITGLPLAQLQNLYIGMKVTGPGVPDNTCLLYTSPSPRDRQKSRMPSSA